jgi:hypothetical protein
MKDVTFLLLVGVWAFPLAALIARRGGGPLGSWIYLDAAAPPRALPTARPALKPALGIAVLAGVAFVVLVAGWRAAIHANVPLAERDTDGYILSFVYRMEWIGVALQALVAVVVAVRARSGGAPVGVLAAFVAGVLIVAAFLGVTRLAGCVDAISIRPGGTCPSPMETSFMWRTLKDWVDEGALLSFLALPVAFGARRLLRRAPAPASDPSFESSAV